MSAIDSAVEWQRHQLADGAQSAKVIQTEAAAADHSGASVRRAKAQLRIKSERCGDQWFWSLPNQPQDAQDEQSPAAELQGAQAQGAHAPDAPAQDAHALADLAQDAHGQDTQGAQDAQDQPTKRNRIITIKRHGEAQGPNEMSWAEFEAIGCDQTRVREYVKQRDQQQKEESAHAEA